MTRLSGTRAPRTTHPKVLHDLSALFSLVAAQDIQIDNHFFWKTKAEVVRRIADLGCGELIPSTFSCASVREATRSGGQHCGVCSQCLDRRFGVLAADCGRFEPSTIYEVDLFRGERQPGADTIMAEVYVLAAQRYAGSTEPGFLGSFAEVLRAAPYLGNLPASEVVARLHRLHQRHGQAVTAVVGQAMASVSTLADHLVLPNNSLLSMIMGSQAQDVVCADPVEREASATAQAEVRPLQILSRPIPFSVSADGSRAVFAGKVSVRGKLAQLITVLLPNFVTTKFVAAAKVATTLQTTEGALRTLISRTRAELSTQFQDVFGVHLAADDVIENSR